MLFRVRLGHEVSVVVFWQRKLGIWADINSPIKSRRTQTNKVAVNGRGEKKEEEEGDLLYRSRMFSCSHAPRTGAISPRCAVYGLILPMTSSGL